MLDVLWIIFLLFGIILMLIIAEFDYYDYPYHWIIVLSLMDIIIWSILAASAWQIEIPYEMFNATSGYIETGSHLFTSQVSEGLAYFCIMMMTVMIVYFSFTCLMAFKALYDKRGRV